MMEYWENCIHYQWSSTSGGIDVRNRVFRIAALIAVLMLACGAWAENMISTTVVLRVSHMTQNAVVDAGEDLSMEVSIEGVEPASYQWYFENFPIAGANQKVYSIVNAQPEDTGVYRMDAFDEEGNMVVSMDISARVVTPEVPKAGDSSLPVGAALGAMAAAAGLLAATRRRGVAA